MAEGDVLDLSTVFTEPPRPPSPEPTFATYVREGEDTQTQSDWTEVRIRLVGSHPLWGHYLWNAALALASYLDSNQGIYKDRYVLELGAGGALPSIVSAINGAKKVVITDYPDKALVDNVRFNVLENIKKEYSDRVEVEGYIWGHPVEHLLSLLPCGECRFDLVILSDLIFNHSQHDALIETCNQVLSSRTFESSVIPCVLVFYTHHRPHLAHRDMEFFAKACRNGWKCEKIITRTFPPMFPDDSGEESIRSTVHGWILTRDELN